MKLQQPDDLRSLIDDAFAEITGWGVIVAFLILLASWPLVRGLGWLVGSVLGRIPGIQVGIVRSAQRLAQFVVVVVAIALAIAVLDIGAGAVAVIVLVVVVIGGYIVAAVVQGLAAATALPYVVGDQIGTHDFEGTVADITLRQTLIETLDHRKVYVPNVEIMATPIVVYSAYRQRRSSIEIGITYLTDLERVSELAVAAMKTVDGVHSDPPPYTLPTGFADGTYVLMLRWWHDPDIAAAERCLGSVIAAVKEALDDEGIPIPPPAAIFLSELPENRHLERRDRP